MKKQLFTITIMCVLIFATNLAFAQNKVVVVPLGGDSDTTGGTNSFENGSISVFTGTPVTVLTREISLKRPGHVVVMATWQFGLNSGEGGDCAITLNSEDYSETFSNGSTLGSGASSSFNEDALAATGFFTHVPAGANTVRLVCQSVFSNTVITVRKRSLSVIFVSENIS